MRKVIKYFLSLLSFLAIAALALPVTLALIFNIGALQNSIAQRAAAFASSATGTTVSIGEIRIRGYNTVTARDFYVEDHNGDTLVYVRDLKASIKIKDLIFGKVRFPKARLDGVKVFLYQPADGEVNITKVIDSFIDPEKPDNSEEPIILENVAVMNAEFRYRSGRPYAPVPDTMIDFQDIALTDLNITSDRLLIKGHLILFENLWLQFADKSGFRVKDMTADVYEIDGSRMVFANTRIISEDSNVWLKMLELDAGTWQDYGDYNDGVPMNIKLRRTDISAAVLSYFVPNLNRNSDVLLKNITVTFNGTVNGFSGDIASLGNSKFNVSGRYGMRDATAPGKTYFNLELSDLKTDGTETVRILNELRELTALELPPATAAILERAGSYTFVGTLEGGYEDFRVDGKLNTDIGAVSMDLAMKLPEGTTSLEGKIDGEEVDLGRLLSTAYVGRASLSGDIKGNFREDSDYVSTATHVSSIEIAGSRYEGVMLNGVYDNGRLTGGVTSLDPDLAFKADGEVDISGESAKFDIDVFAGNVTLRRLGLDRNNSQAGLRFSARLSGSGSTLDDFNGTVSINDFALIKKGDTTVVDNILIRGVNNAEAKLLTLTSSVVDAEYSSQTGYEDVGRFFANLLSDYLPSWSNAPRRDEWKSGNTFERFTNDNPAGDDATIPIYKGRNSRLTVNVKLSQELADLLPAGMNIADNTRLSLRFNPSTRYINAFAVSDYIEYGNILVTRPGLHVNNRNTDNTLSVTLSTEDIYTNTFTMPALNIEAKLKDDNIDVEADISNEKTDFYANLLFNMSVSKDIAGERNVSVRVLPSALYAMKQIWRLESEPILYSGAGWNIDNLRLYNGEQSLSANGVVSDKQSDTLNIDLRNLNIQMLSDLMHIEGYDIGGIANGYAKISSVNHKARLDSDLMIEDISINDAELFPLHFRSLWDFEAENILFELDNAETNTSLLKGAFKPQSGEYSAQADVNSLPLALIGPAFDGVISNISGYMSVNLTLEGGPDRSKINGEIAVTDLSAMIEANNVTYSASSLAIKITDRVADLQSCTIRDHEGNSAALSASANLNSLQNITYRASFATDKIKILNTSHNYNSVYYGDVYAAGRLNIDGSKMGVTVTGDIAATNNSTLTAIVSGQSGMVNSDFITFRSKTMREAPKDQLSIKKLMYERTLRNRDDKQQFKINILAGLYVRPDTDISLWLDQAGDNRLHMNGTAMLNLSYNMQRNEFSVYGSYDISEGRFIFNFQNVIVDKVFVLQPGGTVQWTGDPLDAMLNIRAAYSLKASLAPIATTTELSRSGRVPVECIVAVTNRLSQPELNFDVRVTTTDATVQNSLNSLLATQEMTAIQFFYLVAFNNFYADSGYGQGTNIGTMETASIGFDFLAGQISSWISSENTNIILRYKTHDVYNSDEIDVGLSKELLNNRLIVEVEGNFDTGSNPSSTAANSQRGNISGDASLTWLINNSGNLRVKGFTRTIDRFDENQGLQENGVGMYYREDFNKFSDIIDRSRKRKAERRLKRMENERVESGQIAEVE